MSLSHICRVPWEEKRDLQSLELELQGVERALTSMLATKLHVSSATGEYLNPHTLSKKHKQNLNTQKGTMPALSPYTIDKLKK